ncbi:MAG: hypothetical protein ACYC2E_04615 [Sulfuricella sp.]
MMKLILAAMLVAVSLSALADEYVNGYTKRDGTYVAPHYRTTPDSTLNNNYSTQGNANPYTGQDGTVNPYPQPQYQPVPPVRPYYPAYPR